MCDELGTSPWIWIETTKLPVPLKTSPVPVTPLVFIESIVNVAEGDGDGTAAAAPPQAIAVSRTSIAAHMRTMSADWLAKLQSTCGRGHQPPDRLDLLGIDRVAHLRVERGSHHGTHPREYVGCLEDPFLAYVRVDVAAAEEGWGAAKTSRVAAGRALRPNQPAAETHHAAEVAGVARGEFQGQTRTLREAEQNDPIR